MTAIPAPLTPFGLDLPGIRRAVDAVLTDFLHHKAQAAVENRLPGEVTQILGDFLLTGGKRLRPALCVTGWHAAGGHGDISPVLQVAASLEMFHAFCLIHDDVMDQSATRRGRPTIHRTLTQHHKNGRTAAAAERLGAGTAILIGDLALTWADELLHTAGLTPGQLSRVLPVIDTMRTEVMYGQYLDVTAASRPTVDVEQALRIVRYKTAKYTIERPLHIGAALNSTPSAVREALSAYALPLGEAFQLRDDLLSVFGRPEVTGKPTLDDLREGKHTVLLALATQRATDTQRANLDHLVGDPGLDDDGAARIREVLEATSARTSVESMIATRYEQALAALENAPLPPAAAITLRRIAALAVERTS
ncbi:polyprenyl synthetase family protein [Streptomyces olivoreticuli]|uniref:polyprenyl synthetase family protein n=1 Tax=Streptomyces olivoreticuli TaxID=68246 RepID=UPI002659A98E|nr:polyprenyl synthetase family protein [Streptomyces olivoreticuli]WKK24006.1 polyprenyl synthetase family protein [Streptomyces olivoreticuli]